MKYLSEFRNPALARQLLKKIEDEADGRAVTLMEVCGTHTAAIFRSGLRPLLPSSLRLLSGPGCPVCVTPLSTLDEVIAYARRRETVIATFGDMIEVPGSASSLRREKSRGADIRLVYSPLESLALARALPEKKVILLAIGFETTMPAVAAAVIEAEQKRLKNFFILPAGKRILPAMESLLQGKSSNIDGFICPGHVSAIIGQKPYRRLARRYHVPCAITGFEPLDILLAIHNLLWLIKEREAEAINLYPRAVKTAGNLRALQAIDKIFRVDKSEWRGLGLIPESGFFLRREFKQFDIRHTLPLDLPPPRENPSCRCGEILRGRKEPADCPAFPTACTPSHPLGPCMVSSEGTCATWYKYRRRPLSPSKK